MSRNDIYFSFTHSRVSAHFIVLTSLIGGNVSTKLLKIQRTKGCNQWKYDTEHGHALWNVRDQLKDLQKSSKWINLVLCFLIIKNNNNSHIWKNPWFKRCFLNRVIPYIHNSSYFFFAYEIYQSKSLNKFDINSSGRIRIAQRSRGTTWFRNPIDIDQ